MAEFFVINNYLVSKHSEVAESFVVCQAGTGVILPEDTLVAALECKHVIIQSLDEVKGDCHLDIH